jgi:hypothetical protein
VKLAALFFYGGHPFVNGPAQRRSLRAFRWAAARMTRASLLQSRHLLLAGVLALACLAASCPRRVDLVLINKSAHPVTLVITRAAGDTADPDCKCPDGLRTPQLATGPSIDQIEITQPEWIPLDTTVFQYHAEGPRIELIVPARTVLRVDQALAEADQVGTGRIRGEGGLAISTLELKYQGLDTVWTQAQIVKEFKSRKRSLFVHVVQG